MAEDEQRPDKPSDDASAGETPPPRDVIDDEIFKALHGGFGRRSFGFSDTLKIVKQSMDDFHRRQEEMFSGSSLAKVLRESKTFSDRIADLDNGWRKRLGLDKIGKPLLPKSLLEAHKSIVGSLPMPKIPESPWMKLCRELGDLRLAKDRLKPSEIAADIHPISDSLHGIADDLQRIRETTIKLTMPCPVRRPKPQEERPLGEVTTSVGMPPLPPPPPEHVMGLAKAEQSARQAGEAVESAKESAKDGKLTKAQAKDVMAKVENFVTDLSDAVRIKVTAEIEKASGEKVCISQEVRSAAVQVRQGEVIDVSAAETAPPREGATQGGGGVPPAPDADESAELGEWATSLVKSVDWKKRVIVFKDRSRNTVRMPPKSDEAWAYMKRLLTEEDPEGWVELIGKDDANWTADFDRRDDYGCVDAKNPLTILRCRIKPFRKRGRPKQSETWDAAEKNNPMIRLAPFDKELFDSYATTQRNTKKGRK